MLPHETHIIKSYITSEKPWNTQDELSSFRVNNVTQVIDEKIS